MEFRQSQIGDLDQIVRLVPIGTDQMRVREARTVRWGLVFKSDMNNVARKIAYLSGRGLAGRSAY